MLKLMKIIFVSGIMMLSSISYANTYMTSQVHIYQHMSRSEKMHAIKLMIQTLPRPGTNTLYIYYINPKSEKMADNIKNCIQNKVPTNTNIIVSSKPNAVINNSNTMHVILVNQHSNS